MEKKRGDVLAVFDPPEEKPIAEAEPVPVCFEYLLNACIVLRYDLILEANRGSPEPVN